MKVARPVLRGPWCSNAPGLPDKKRSRFYPRVRVDTAGVPAVGQAGGVLLTEAVAAAGLDTALSAALAAWRKPLAVHDPGKVVLDLAVSLALGGDCLADIALLRSEPGVYGRVASDPTVSRTIDALAADAPAALKAIDAARAETRARVWELAGVHAPDHQASAAAPLVIDMDATLVTAHSEKERAAPTFKRGFGFHPLWTFLDHGPEGSGEPLAVMLRAGNAGSNTAADHIAVARQALAQLPSHRPGHQRGRRPGRRVLIRTDGAGASHEFLDWLHRRRLSYSIGFDLPEDTTQLLKKIPADVWTLAFDAHDEIRDGAWVAELTGLLDLSGWPPGCGSSPARNDPTPARSYGSPTPRTAGHRLRHQHHPRAAGRPGTTAPPPGPRRGPHPLREGHRADQPPAARLRPEPDLVRHSRVGLRPDRLDADPRPARSPRPPVGTETVPGPAVHRPGHPRPHRPSPAAAPGRPPPLGHRHPRRRPPAP